MTFEVIIAPDRERAEAYAIERGWRSGFGQFRRLIASGVLVDGVPLSLEDRVVRFVATPMALDEVPRGTHVHIAGFPSGVPAAWAKALSRHDVVKDPA